MFTGARQQEMEDEAVRKTDIVGADERTYRSGLDEMT